MTSDEQLTDKLTERAKAQAGFSDLPKDAETQATLKVIRSLAQMPKSKVPTVDFLRIKNQILDRIAVPAEEKVQTAFGMFLQSLPRILRVGGGLIGGILILISMTIGTVVSALGSVPGQPIYPVKKVVENLQIKLANTDAEKTNLQIKFANNRLEELEKVLEQNKQGKVSGAEVQKIVENTIKDVTKATGAVSDVSPDNDQADQPQTNLANKLVDLTTKQTALVQAATSQSDGDVKAELEKALEASKASQEQTIANIEKAGMKVEGSPVVTEEDAEPDDVSASGQITKLTETDFSIGSAKFLLTNETKFVNMKRDDLKVGQIVNIKGQLVNSNTYATEIELTEDVTVTPPVNDNDDTLPVEAPATEESGQQAN
jgi:hypothetical protein